MRHRSACFQCKIILGPPIAVATHILLPRMDIFIKFENIAAHVFRVEPMNSIGSLMEMVQKRLGIPTERQKLSYKGRQISLFPKCTLHDFSVKCDSIIYLSWKNDSGLEAEKLKDQIFKLCKIHIDETLYDWIKCYRHNLDFVNYSSITTRPLIVLTFEKNLLREVPTPFSIELKIMEEDTCGSVIAFESVGESKFDCDNDTVIWRTHSPLKNGTYYGIWVTVKGGGASLRVNTKWGHFRTEDQRQLMLMRTHIGEKFTSKHSCSTITDLCAIYFHMFKKSEMEHTKVDSEENARIPKFFHFQANGETKLIKTDKDVMSLANHSVILIQMPEDPPIIISQDKDIPSYLICPITCDIMQHPVICSDGHSYEKSAIEKWFHTSTRSPKTNLPLANRTLIPNIALRLAIESFQEKQK